MSVYRKQENMRYLTGRECTQAQNLCELFYVTNIFVNIHDLLHGTTNTRKLKHRRFLDANGRRKLRVLFPGDSVCNKRYISVAFSLKC